MQPLPQFPPLSGIQRFNLPHKRPCRRKIPRCASAFRRIGKARGRGSGPRRLFAPRRFRHAAQPHGVRLVFPAFRQRLRRRHVPALQQRHTPPQPHVPGQLQHARRCIQPTRLQRPAVCRKLILKPRAVAGVALRIRQKLRLLSFQHAVFPARPLPRRIRRSHLRRPQPFRRQPPAELLPENLAGRAAEVLQLPLRNLRKLVPEIPPGLQRVAPLPLLHIGRLPLGKLPARRKQPLFHARLLVAHMLPRQHAADLLRRPRNGRHRLRAARVHRHGRHPHRPRHTNARRPHLPPVLLQSRHLSPL